MMRDYFTRRTPKRAPDYETAYWGTVVDPDGNVRDRLMERQKHLDDVREELDYLNQLPPGRILDVGCGLGYLLSGLGPGWERHGVEVSRFAADHARQYGTIHVGELADASYPDAYFDAVVMHHVIEHVANPDAVILEARRVLRPGGVLVLGTPDFDSGCARRFGENYRLLHDDTHISLFTNDSMHRFLRDHGFEIDRVGYPFFETRYFTAENLLRLFDTTKVSPPFYGNFMTFYCRRPAEGAREIISELGRLLTSLAEGCGKPIQRAGEAVARALAGGGQVLVHNDEGSEELARRFLEEITGRAQFSRAPPKTHVFGRDREAAKARGSSDVLLAISQGAVSPGLVGAMEAARGHGSAVVALTARNTVLWLPDGAVHVEVPASHPRLVRSLLSASLDAIYEIAAGCLETRGA
jgi:SAM-dependent methyltransferase